MESKSLKYVPGLDVLRLLAATCVILYHVYDWSPSTSNKYIVSFFDLSSFSNIIFTRGHIGVSLFFVMSGYLMACIFMKYPNATYSEFIFNRVVRIFPLFLLVALGEILLSGKTSDVYIFIFDILTFQLNVDRSFFGVATLWTIAVEFQFYLIFPLINKIILKNKIAPIVKMCVAIFIFKFFIILNFMYRSNFSYDISYYTIFGRFDQFFIGVIIAHKKDFIIHFLRSRINIILAPASCFLIMYLGGLHNWFEKSIYNCIIQSIYLTVEGLVCGYLMSAFLALKKPIVFESQLAFLGSASYSMYMLHEIIIRDYMLLFPHYIFSVKIDAIFIILPTVYIVSLAMFKFFEVPFLNFRRKYS